MTSDGSNLDAAVVRAFGEEWTRFERSALGGAEYERLFDSYFAVFPWDRLPNGAIGLMLAVEAGAGRAVSLRALEDCTTSTPAPIRWRSPGEIFMIKATANFTLQRLPHAVGRRLDALWLLPRRAASRA